MKSYLPRIIVASFAVFVLFAYFAIFVPPASADGLIYVQCPPVILPPNGGTVIPMPMPRSLGDGPQGTPMPPTIATVAPVMPVRRDCATYLTVKNHNVTVTIDNQVARTHVDETFTNDSVYALEGTYIFPLPDDATISDFAMWMDGKRVEGRVLDKVQARQIYEDIVRRQRDPALLEYVGRNAFQASIFPIPPKTDKRVEIDYSQVLKAEQGLVQYVYPLNTEKFSPQPLKNVSVNVALKSSAAIKAIYSPSHNVSVSRRGDYSAQVGYEDSNVKPNRDFILYYSVTQDEIGLNLLSYKAGSEDGFFMMLVAPKVTVDTTRVVDKDVILVLDVSGSMQGAKIAQAKNALTYVLDHLNSGDRFNIITFSTGTNSYASSLQPAVRREDARNFVSRLVAEGSTDINRALLEAMSMTNKDRPTIIIFLTDGLPTTGETNSQKIIANVSGGAPKNVRLFTFGVGDDVNTILLDSLADKLRGASGYVRPTEKIDEIVSAFYAKVATPVLSDITVDWGGISVNDVYPYPMPDLFIGTQLIITGRYRGSGPTTIFLKGAVNGVPQSFKYSDVTFSASGGEDSIPRLWATRKIGYLLNEIRLHGESKESVNEIVALAVRYGIVTPYTSFLIDERVDVLTQAGRSAAANSASSSMAPASSSGSKAVDQSQFQSQLRGAVAPMAMPTAAPRLSVGGAPVAPQSEAASVVTIQAIGDKTFLLRNGVWTDSQFDPSMMTTKKIEFGSEAYFALATSNPELVKYLALGSRVIVVIDTMAYEITDTGVGVTSPNMVGSGRPVSFDAARSFQGRELQAATPNAQPTPRPVNQVTSMAESGFQNVALIAGGGALVLGAIGVGIGLAIITVRKI